MNRRDAIRQTGRVVILSGIGLLSIFLATNQKVVTPENCSVSLLCGNCSKFSKCELPQAKKERSHGK